MNLSSQVIQNHPPAVGRTPTSSTLTANSHKQKAEDKKRAPRSFAGLLIVVPFRHKAAVSHGYSSECDEEKRRDLNQYRADIPGAQCLRDPQE